tara:strand:- start:3614 stop:3955 length:342 start_codon:yes stop_codon:yes gene_type:complete
MSMVRRLESDIRDALSGEGQREQGRFFELTMQRADHLLRSVDEFRAVACAAEAVGAHIFETRDMRRVPDGGHTFLLEGDDKSVYYFMHCRDSYLVQLWILDRIRGAKVGGCLM